MTVEYAPVRAVHKPWGSTDLRPWANIRDCDPVGELWFERPGMSASDLLFKLLFTTENLSIQVHPSDGLAPSIGMVHGKSEAWVVLAAAPGSKIGLGLCHHVTPEQLRASIENGSILELVQWREVVQGDVVFVPAGTIHAIGAGLVVAEVQQNIEATLRLYDYGRGRKLDIEKAIAVSNLGPAQEWPLPQALTHARSLLVTDSHFILEQIALPANSDWTLAADIEVWLLIVEGHARLDRMTLSHGEAIFLKADRTMIHCSDSGLKGFLAYCAGTPAPDLLRQVSKDSATRPVSILVPQPWQ
jgi:mannose-6-phosphate isomerase